MYDFSTLNDFEFEKLACDALIIRLKENNIYGSVQTFKKGKDNGIDLLVSTKETAYKIIGQVKHYVNTPYSVLKSQIKNSEAKKVRDLNPDNYFFITSLKLSPANKLEIQNIFSPYIESLAQILGKDDLNDIIRNNPEIEEKHYKLWFSSSITLKKILNLKYEGRRKQFSEFILKKRIRIFVTTPDFLNSLHVLQENKYLIITGEPGSGKTIISDMIVYNYLKQDFSLNIIYDNIREIEDCLRDDGSKQLFFFDDFLGHTQAEIAKSKSAENFLIKIISRLESLENKYLILNTRKFILNSFINESERLVNIDFLKSESKIELQKYSYGIKRRILDNHINESNLTIEQVSVITKFAHSICVHKNFSPRIIEFFTGEIIKNLNASDYRKFIIENIENPKRIWNHAYKKQISNYDRLLLNTLYSLKSETKLNTLNNCYNSRLSFEVKENNFIKPLDSFNDSIRDLNNGFINIYDSISFLGKKEFKNISFINPSLEDFMHHLIEENPNEIERILKSAAFIEQWYFFFPTYINKKNQIDQINPNYLLDNLNVLMFDNRSKFLSSCFIFFNFNSKEKLIKSILKSIDSWDFFINTDILTHMCINDFLNNAKSNNLLNEFISNLDISFFILTIENSETYYDLMECVTLLEKHYNFSIIKNMNIDPNSDLKFIVKRISISYLEEVNEFEKYLNNNYTQNEHQDVIYKLEKEQEYIKEYINPKFHYCLKYIKEKNWNDIAMENYKNSLVESKSIYYKKTIEDDIENDILNNWDYYYEYANNEFDDYYKEDLNGKFLFKL